MWWGATSMTVTIYAGGTTVLTYDEARVSWREVDDPGERPWPCARATPPGAPPVSLELAALERQVARRRPVEAARMLPSGRLLRLHARAPVPARTRRRRRRWER